MAEQHISTAEIMLNMLQRTVKKLERETELFVAEIAKSSGASPITLKIPKFLNIVHAEILFFRVVHLS